MIINFESDYEDVLKNAKAEVKEPDDAFNKYYYLYEYSDEFDVIKDDPRYPSMLNYVKTGLLTKEEMIEAMTCTKRS